MALLREPSSERVVSAVVLLAGGLVLPPLARSAGRSVLDLTIAPGETVLGQWARLIAPVRGVPVRAVHGPQIPAPLVCGALRDQIEVIRERDAYRGPAGAIRDVITDLPSDEWALVIEATRFHNATLDPMLDAVARDDADVLVSCNSDHTPAGVYAMRRSVLDHVASVGYVDLKEQLLARARAAGDRVSVVEHPGVVSFPLRTRTELLRAASISGGERSSTAPGPGAPRVLTGQRWPSVIADDARVDPTAVVVESIVMPGARIDRDAVVARAVVCPDAHVAAGAVVLDQVITGASTHRTGTGGIGEDRRRSPSFPRVSRVRLGRRADRTQGTAS